MDVHKHGPTILGPHDGAAGFLGTIGVRWLIDAKDSGDHFALVEHPMAPRALAAPLHRHSREDEYSFVLEGQLGALLGDDVVYASPGDLVFKPRAQWHTFWNAGHTPARILEIIAPAGFETFFREVVAQGGVTRIPPADFSDLCDAYGLEMQIDSVPDLVRRFDLRFPGTPL
ncbi:cupin domain-containing protein [Xanthobacteraceae bacterium Astr-EGSB]|uniref:cupin domain-containing protein n=1 Tax=Astrobacterium formosum TaxID=3069710 RepID=UPI0027B06744|nr:cupin domain-containing protein [Xanthobacteraceae bacterium Astr-EGSB]